MIKIKCDVCAQKYPMEEERCPSCHALTSENSIVNAEHQLTVNDIMYSLDDKWDEMLKAMELYRESKYKEAMAKQLPWYKNKEKKQLENNSVILCTHALGKILDIFLLTIEGCELYNLMDFCFEVLKKQSLPNYNQKLFNDTRQSIVEYQKKRKRELMRRL